jgi:tight adherence protein C
MLAVIGVLTALTVVLIVLSVMQVGTRRGAVTTRLEQMDGGGTDDILARRRRQAKSERLKHVLKALGSRVEGGRKDTTAVRRFLVQAGYTDPNAVAFYWASRLALAMGLGLAAMLALPLIRANPTQILLGAAWLGGLGWVAPAFYVRSRLKARQKELQLALPDMLDMLVVCVEAGLGLNQALVRVADEIDHVSRVMSEQLAMVNLEMRAGTPRDEALKNFAERTGLADIRSLVSMII